MLKWPFSKNNSARIPVEIFGVKIGSGRNSRVELLSYLYYFCGRRLIWLLWLAHQNLLLYQTAQENKILGVGTRNEPKYNTGILGVILVKQPLFTQCRLGRPRGETWQERQPLWHASLFFCNSGGSVLFISDFLWLAGVASKFLSFYFSESLSWHLWVDWFITNPGGISKLRLTSYIYANSCAFICFRKKSWFVWRICISVSLSQDTVYTNPALDRGIESLLWGRLTQRLRVCVLCSQHAVVSEESKESGRSTTLSQCMNCAGGFCGFLGLC